MSRILVTGGAGFIGSNLTEGLLKRGHSVRVLDNFSTGKMSNLVFDKEYPLEIIKGDIRSLPICKKTSEGMDYVFHLAAIPSVQLSVEDPGPSNAVNSGGTFNVLLAAKEKGVKRVIFADSSAVYGDTSILPTHEDLPPHPLSPYALQKYTGEQYCKLFYKLYELETVSLKYFNIFGPKQDPNSEYSAVIPKFIDALLNGRPPVVFGDGEQSRDFTYIENVVHANILAMEATFLYGMVLNVACGRRFSLNQLLVVLKRIIGSEIQPVYSGPRPGEVRHSLADISKARGVLGYEPTVDFEAGLKKTVEFMRGT
jgi:UDP-glucose 4-epimerase